MLYSTNQRRHDTHSNQGKLTGQKPPLKLPELSAIRTRLQRHSHPAMKRANPFKSRRFFNPAVAEIDYRI